MSYEPLEGSDREAYERPTVSVWTNGRLAFNEAAVEEWFDGNEFVRVMIHEDEPLAAIKGVEEKTEEHDLTLMTHGDYDGRLVEARKLLKRLGCVRPEEAMELSAEEESDGSVIVNFDILT